MLRKKEGLFTEFCEKLFFIAVLPHCMSGVEDYVLREQFTIEAAKAIYNILPHRDARWLDDLLVRPIATENERGQFWQHHSDFRALVTSELSEGSVMLSQKDLQEFYLEPKNQQFLFAQAYQLLSVEQPPLRTCTSPRCNFTYILTHDTACLPHAFSQYPDEKKRQRRQEYLNGLCPHEIDHIISGYCLPTDAANNIQGKRAVLDRAARKGLLRATRVEGKPNGSWLIHKEDAMAYRESEYFGVRGRPRKK